MRAARLMPPLLGSPSKPLLALGTSGGTSIWSGMPADYIVTKDSILL
jgi:hypothetical protein